MEYSTLLPQIHRLHAQVPKNRTLAVLIRTLFGTGFPKEKPGKALTYIYLTRLLWEYIEEVLPEELASLQEPRGDTAQLVKWKKRYVSHELAKALLDYHTITSSMSEKPRRVLIMGAHHWHLAYVFLAQPSPAQYVMVDTLDSLQKAYHHLSHAFPEKVFAMHPSSEAAISFIQPSDLSKLPAGSIDLGIMIDFFDQLDKNALGHHFAEISQLVNGHMYFKQHKKGRLREADYLVPDEWEEVFWRTCPLYPLSFEALFQKGSQL